ncbi:MAG: hypothetical protein ACRD8A_12590 [Candidatus Acidiferrales bacterium]
MNSKATKLLAAIFFLLSPFVARAQLANPVTNAGTTGTTLNLLAKLNTSNQAVLATTSDTGVPVYIVVGGAGTTGVGQLATLGQALCTMDATNGSFSSQPVYVVASTTTSGECHPQTAAPTGGTWVVGFLAAPATTSGSTALVQVNGGFLVPSAGSGTVTDGAGTASPGLLAESTSSAHVQQYVTANASAVGLGSVTNDAQAKAAVLPNTLPSAGQILAGNSGGTAYAPVTVGGDGTLSSAGSLTVTKTNGTAFTSAATMAAGTNAVAAFGVADTTFTTGTTAVSANTCTTASTVTMTGVTTSMAFVVTPSTDASAVNGWGSTGGLVLDVWPTANTLNYKVCNQTASSITPGSLTWNVGVR